MRRLCISSGNPDRRRGLRDKARVARTRIRVFAGRRPRRVRRRFYGRRAAADTTGRPARVLCVPVDRRLPKIRIQTRQAPALADQRLVVAIDAWPADSPYPLGHYVSTLGPIGDADAETAAVLLEADVDDRPFAPAVHACVPPLPWQFDETTHLSQQPWREDHRALRVCSVDPPGVPRHRRRALLPRDRFLGRRPNEAAYVRAGRAHRGRRPRS